MGKLKIAIGWGAIALLLSLLLWGVGADVAFASIHTYADSPSTTVRRSLQARRDLDDRAWQTILFQRRRAGKVEALHLRLVGFPGKVAIDRAQPLTASSGTGETWQLTDVSADVRVSESLPPNVAEYDARELMAQLDRAKPLRLYVPLQQGAIAELPIPPFEVEEWRKLVSGDFDPQT